MVVSGCLLTAWTIHVSLVQSRGLFVKSDKVLHSREFQYCRLQRDKNGSASDGVCKSNGNEYGSRP